MKFLVTLIAVASLMETSAFSPSAPSSSRRARTHLVQVPTQNSLQRNAIQVLPFSVHDYSYFESDSSSTSTTTSLRAFPDENSSLIIAASEGWRDYVPLIVICGVLLDIVLGSPLANIALSPMRRAAGVGDGDNDSEDSNKSNPFVKNPKERVDTDGIADAAIQKARYSMELRRFLDENKTDEQKYEEIRKKIDQQAQDLEDNLDKIGK